MSTSSALACSLALLTALACAACDDGHGSRRQSTRPEAATDRTSGAPDSALVAGTDRSVALVGADGTVRPVPGLLAGFDTDAAVLDADRFVVVSDDLVAVVRTDGSVRQADCTGCQGVAVTPSGIVTVQANFEPGSGFDVVRLDDTLDVVSRGHAARVVERPVDSTTLPDETPAILLGATTTRAYVGYLSRTGGIRQGPWVIAAHRLDGRLAAVDVENGKVYEHALSPDGRYLALSIGGNGGACVDSNHLAVIDTRTMTDLGTEPRLPSGLGVTSDQAGQAWFESSHLVWGGSSGAPVVTDSGRVHRPDSSGCDPRPDLYQRQYDPARQAMSDAGPLDQAHVGWLGDDCKDGLFLVNPRPRPHLLVVSAGQPVVVPKQWTTVLAAPPPPPGCTP